MIHLTLNQISAYLDGELPQASIELVRLHLSSCLECTERFGHIEEQEEALGRLLVNDPGAAFFAGFAERVLGSAAAHDSAPAKAPAAAAHEPAAAPAEPRPAAPAPRPRAPHAPRRPASHRARHAVLAASLLLVVSAIAVVAMRRGMMDSPSASWILEHLDPTSWFRSGADRSGALSSVDDRSPEKPPAAPADSNGSYPTVIDSGALDRAAARSAMAESVGSPEAYDDAAEAWLDALPLLANDPEELASGRREVASSRYVAWSLLPTPERRAAALEAVRAYLLCAPPGPQRDLAWKWLARLKR